MAKESQLAVMTLEPSWENAAQFTFCPCSESTSNLSEVLPSQIEAVELLHAVRILRPSGLNSALLSSSGWFKSFPTFSPVLQFHRRAKLSSPVVSNVLPSGLKRMVRQL